MNALERRSIQRKGWLGLAVFAVIPVVGVLLLSASFSLFMVVLLGGLLLGAFTLGGTLLKRQLQAGKRGAVIEGTAPSRATLRSR